MKAKELHQKMVESIEEVVGHIFPSGHRTGQEWSVGSVGGERGDSLKVRLSGEKAGLWSDFATGEKGDLIDLWRKVFDKNFLESVKEVKEFLGIKEEESGFIKPRKDYKKPENFDGKPVYGAALDYLKNRGIKDETLRAFGVRSTDGEIIFPSHLPDGTLVRQKTLKLERKNGKKEMYVTRDGEPVLFGWQALHPDARGVTICEGEIDCLTLWQMDVPALSVPFGAGVGAKNDWVEREYERLSSFDEIYLCFDMDEEGQKSIADLIPRLGRDRCRIVKLPRKDPNECLQAGIDLFPFFLNAAYCDPEGLHPSTEFLPDAMDILLGRKDREEGIPLPWCPTLIIRPSELTIWNGINGHGKTSLLNHLTIEFLSRREKVLYCSFEMSPERLMVQLVKQACGDDRFSDERTKLLGMGLFSGLLLYLGKKDRFDAIRYAIRRYGVTQIVIDNLTRMSKMDDYAGHQEIVQKLSDIKDEYRVHIHLVTHARKGESEAIRPDKFDVRGAGPITDIADNVVTIHRNKEKGSLLELSDIELLRKKTTRIDVQEQADAKLYIQKQRVSGWEGSARIWFDPATCQFGDRYSFDPIVYDHQDNSGW